MLPQHHLQIRCAPAPPQPQSIVSVTMLAKIQYLPYKILYNASLITKLCLPKAAYI